MDAQGSPFPGDRPRGSWAGTPRFGNPPSEPTGPLIRLKAATFEPSEESPLSPRAAAPGARGRRARNLHRPVRGPGRGRLEGRRRRPGGELLEYIPDFAFKVRMTPGAGAAVRRLPSVRWVGLFHPAYKLSPRLKRGGERLYIVRLEPGSDGAARGRDDRCRRAQGSRPEGRTLVVSASAEALRGPGRPSRRGLDRGLRAAEEAQRPRRGRDHGGRAIGQQRRLRRLDPDRGRGRHRPRRRDGGHRPRGHPGRPHRHHLQLAGGADGTCYQTITDDGARDVDSGPRHAHVLVGPRRWRRSAARARARRRARTSSSRRSRTTPPSRSSASSLRYPDGYYLVGIPTDLRTLFQQAYNAGARVHSNSWGSDAAGQYTADSVEPRRLRLEPPGRDDHLLGGQRGRRRGRATAGSTRDSIGSPATAKNVISRRRERERPGERLRLRRHQGRDLRQPGRPERDLHLREAWPFNFPAEPAQERPERRQRRADGRLQQPRRRPTTAGSSPTWWLPGPGCSPATPTSTAGLRPLAQPADEPLPVRRLGLPPERRATSTWAAPRCRTRSWRAERRSCATTTRRPTATRRARPSSRPRSSTPPWTSSTRTTTASTTTPSPSRTSTRAGAG